MLARERPCLEHVQQSGMQVGQPLAHVLSLVFYWRQFNLEESVHPRNGNHAYLICCHQGIAYIMSDKHGFRFYQPISPGGTFHHAQTPCLEKPIPHQGFEVIPGIIIMSCTCFKLGFCPSTVQVVASCLISMVFEIRHPKSPGNNMPPERKPCLEHLQQSGAQIGHHQHMF